MASRTGVLSEGLNLTMILPSSNRYHVLNDRTMNLLMEGKVDTNATTGGPDEPEFSDSESSELIEQEKEMSISVPNIEKPNQAVHSSPSLKKRFTIYLNMELLNRLIKRNNYNHDCLDLALQSGGLPDIKLQDSY